MSDRIRWVPNEDGRDYTPAFRGYAGTSDAALFAVYAPGGTIRSEWVIRSKWALRSELPGQDNYRVGADKPDDLKRHAERWLEMHVTALGACFRGPSCFHCGSELTRAADGSCWLGADESDCCPGAVYHEPEPVPEASS